VLWISHTTDALAERLAELLTRLAATSPDMLLPVAPPQRTVQIVYRLFCTTLKRRMGVQFEAPPLYSSIYVYICICFTPDRRRNVASGGTQRSNGVRGRSLYNQPAETERASPTYPPTCLPVCGPPTLPPKWSVCASRLLVPCACCLLPDST
jgi:hypothetical protein